MSASHNSTTKHSVSQRKASISNTKPPPPFSPSDKMQQGGTDVITSPNNDINDDVDVTISSVPPSVSSKLFGPRIVRLQNRCTLPRIERSGSSTPISRELFELSSSPPIIRARSEFEDSDIDDILNRYTTKLPSSPPTSLQHRRTATISSVRPLHHSTPQPDSSPLPASLGLRRVVACYEASLSSPIHGASSSLSRHKKYNNVSSLESSHGSRYSGAFSTPVSRNFLPNRRSSTAPVDERVEAGTPLLKTSAQRFQASALRDHQHQRTSSTSSSDRTTNAPANIRLRYPAKSPSLNHMFRSKAAPVTTSPLATSTMHSHTNSSLVDVVDVHRPLTSMSHTTSSEFSFVEPSCSLEPAIDILARAEGRKSADQEIKEIEEQNFRSSISATSRHVVHYANNDQQEGDFNKTGSASPHNESEIGQILTGPDVQCPEVTTKQPQTLVVVGPLEVFSGAPTHFGTHPVLDEPEDVLNQSHRLAVLGLSLTAVTTIVETRPRKPLSQLSIAEAKTVPEQLPTFPAEAEAQPDEMTLYHPPVSVKVTSRDSLTSVAAVVIISAWLLCALLRSIVRSMATAEPVQPNWVMKDVLLGMILAAATCFLYHLSLSGRAEAGGVRLRRNVEGLVPGAHRFIIDKLRPDRTT